MFALSIAWSAIILSSSPALACACCTNPGQRNVNVQKLDGGRMAQVEDIRFAPTASLFIGEGDAENVKGIEKPSLTYDMQVAQTASGLTFSFRDKENRSGTLALARPATVSIFEVDPRDSDEEGGLGPSLYKEWKLTSRLAATGIFSPGAGPRQQITLVLQGRGNSCTSSIDFSHWTLIVHGPKTEYHFFGKLLRR